MKRILLLLLAIIVAVSLPFGKIYADEFDDHTIVTEENGTDYLIDSDGNLHFYYDVYGNRVSAYDAIKVNVNKTMINNVWDEPNSYRINTRGQEDPGIQEDYAYVTSYYQYGGVRTKVTPDYVGPCTINYVTSITSTSSWGVSVGVQVKIKVIAAINVVGTYTYSSSSSTSVGAGFPVESGRTAAVYFTPYFMHYDTQYIDYIHSPLQVPVNTPKILSNGLTDGLYELVYYN